MEIIKRSTAIKEGLNRYYSGKACPNGHDAERYTKNRTCVLCTNPERSKELMRVYRSTPLGRYKTYQDGATVRGLEFDLTLEQFTEFWQQPCSYCDDSIETIGLDRIDNNKGYTVDNVCSCCRECNTMKSNRNKDEWLKKLKKIIMITS